MNDISFKNEFLNLASKLDAVTNSCGEIVKIANVIADEQDHDSTIYLIRKIAKIQELLDFIKTLLFTAILNSLSSIMMTVQFMFSSLTSLQRKKTVCSYPATTDTLKVSGTFL